MTSRPEHFEDIDHRGAKPALPEVRARAVSDQVVDRRILLAGAAGVGVLGLGARFAPDRPHVPVPPADSDAPAESEVSGKYLVDTADVPLRGGVIFGTESGDPQVVVTHPGRGTFKCFTSVCTHQGCIVGDVTSNVIECYCHGSQFSARTGDVIRPPAPDPLAARRIRVRGGKIYLV